MNKINGVALIGPPGSGKSVIGKEVAKSFSDMLYISTGDIARKMAITDELTKISLNEGVLAPEDKMRTAIYQALYRINASGREFMLDGGPRNVDQLHWLLQLFPNIQFYLVKSHSVGCIARMLERSRSDDTRDTIQRRMDYYEQQTARILYDIDYTIVPNNGLLYDAISIMKESIGRQLYGITDQQV